MLLKLFKRCTPNDYVVVALDVGGDKGTFRSQIYPEYKANRDDPPEDLAPQVERIKEICDTWAIPMIGVEGYEADDVIATLCERLQQEDALNIKIISKDKDLQQLLGPRVTMMDIHKDTETDEAALLEEKGVRPDQVIDMLALMGDTADNIIGAKGVGPKTASKLIARFGTLDELLSRTDELKGKQKENVEAAADNMPLNVQLVTLVRDVPFEWDLRDAAVKTPPVKPLRDLFRQLGFNRHVTDLEALAGAEPSPEPATPGEMGLFDMHHGDDALPEPTYEKADASRYTLVDTDDKLDELVAAIRKHVKAGGAVSLDTETDRLDANQAKLVGICVALEPESGYYVPVRSSKPGQHLDEETVLKSLGPIIEDPAIAKVGQNLKYDTIVLRRAGLNPAGIGEGGFDTMVASYLIDATRSSHKLDNLALAHLNYAMVPISELIGKGKHQRSMIDLTAEQVATYSAEDADIALRLRDLFAPQLDAMGLNELFETLEMPLVDVLAELEYNGVLVDPDELDHQNQSIDQRIEDLREQILETADTDFNPDSPKQLADVLFNKLGCTVVKRRKTGPSTDSEVLQRIADEQPPPGSILAALILEYRQLTKLRGTYLESLKEAINPQTQRIHSSFNQVVTATGRLSSNNPNLQNIPIRTELGRQIRKAFIAPPDHVLLGADYSQIELRLLAHLSRDEGLIAAFAGGADIHRAVAAQIFEVAPEDVTDEQRSTAKMVNFGIVYGITPFGLARRLPADAAGSSVEIATQIIDDYKARYPGINQFLEECVHTAETRGYVETIRKRRRSVPEVRSNNGNTVQFGRRIAINTVVQGSAADLIKIAMVRLHRRIREESRPMRMLLQIHDELVFEVPTEHVETEAAIIREEMEAAMDLVAPLKVDISWGENWYEAK
jgi:DNA polymerase-1